MVAERACGHQVGVHPLSSEEASLWLAERLLLLVVALALVFAMGIAIRNVAAGSIATTKATITVQPGDTLWALAEKYGEPDVYILQRVDDLARANGIGRNQVLRVGQTLVIPIANDDVSLGQGDEHAARKSTD